MSDIAKQLEEAKAKRAGAEKTRVETHNAAFVAAYLKNSKARTIPTPLSKSRSRASGNAFQVSRRGPTRAFQASSERAE